LRHGLAYRLRADGVDLGVIRQILGHARLETSFVSNALDG